MKFWKTLVWVLLLVHTVGHGIICQTSPDQINFVRQGVKRMVFDPEQSIPLASIQPSSSIGLSVMHPVFHQGDDTATVTMENQQLVVQSEEVSSTAIWLGGFNPFATYTMDLGACTGVGEVGFEFADANGSRQFQVAAAFRDSLLTAVKLTVVVDADTLAHQSIAVNTETITPIRGKLMLQMLGSGFTMYMQDQNLPRVIGQSDFNTYLDLRERVHIRSFQSRLLVQLSKGEVRIHKADMALTTGVGLADIRAITYENGKVMLDQGRLWYTMSIRGRALPHHLQGVFSMDPTVFDLKLEGIIVFDRRDGLLRNEIASHLFYDRNEQLWRGLTTGFSAYARPDQEKKQLLAIESKRDPRHGFSVMQAVPFGMVGDIEDPHILFDSLAQKWRMLTCTNQDGYKAIVLESDHWDRDYQLIAGPVAHNSTGTSIQRIGNQRYCFSGSSERKIFIYTYPDLKEAGILKMDLPPWDDTSGTRVWPNVVQLPESYPVRYIALMMDRFNYPGLQGPNWSYGAVYLYHGW